ncbi:hypothetical protein HGRIS_002619 [Hohenbuehelia grisea]|uniref:Non-structural maintenance of chromosomes element 4 n=1 Tax=Hohenbuehelia grisea TaxID=104357 RepID=A0ABR3JM68_9AGAR
MDGIEMNLADLAFDPDQDPEEKRAVRKKYRSLAKSMEEQQAASTYTAEDLTKRVQHADELFNKVKGPQEATLDSAFLLMASTMGAQKARAMKSGTGSFDVDEFVAKLVTFMGGSPALKEDIPDDSDDDQTYELAMQLDWEKIARKALARSKRVPVQTFMLGPLSIEQKKRAVVKRARLEKRKEDLKKPQEIKEEDIERSQNETTKNVAILQRILEEIGEDKINLFRFVVNPNDFAQSVENIFYLSFLIRDGNVALEIEDDGEPLIFLCDPPTDEMYNEGLKKHQIVMEFDMDTWKRAIEVFDIKDSRIPQRPAAQTRLGDKWYG